MRQHSTDLRCMSARVSSRTVSVRTCRTSLVVVRQPPFCARAPIRPSYSTHDTCSPHTQRRLSTCEALQPRRSAHHPSKRHPSAIDPRQPIANKAAPSSCPALNTGPPPVPASLARPRPPQHRPVRLVRRHRVRLHRAWQRVRGAHSVPHVRSVLCCRRHPYHPYHPAVMSEQN